MFCVLTVVHVPHAVLLLQDLQAQLERERETALEAVAQAQREMSTVSRRERGRRKKNAREIDRRADVYPTHRPTDPQTHGHIGRQETGSPMKRELSIWVPYVLCAIITLLNDDEHIYS